MAVDEFGRFTPEMQALLAKFDHPDLPEGLPRATANVIGALARTVARALPDLPDLITVLEKLHNANESILHAALAAQQEDGA